MTETHMDKQNGISATAARRAAQPLCSTRVKNLIKLGMSKGKAIIAETQESVILLLQEVEYYNITNERLV